MGLKDRYDHKIIEEGKYEFWKNKGYFTAGDVSKQKFSMVIPPPNVTGKLHLGHAANTTIQDILARYKKAQGFDVLWLPGMDHAGIATQAKVEQKLREQGISRFDLGREKFLEKTWEWKEEYSLSIREQWQKLGLALDYTKERFTLDDGISEAVKKVFVDLYHKGLIYRGERIINWDPKQMTALSNIEVIHKEEEGKFYYFKYKHADRDDYLEVATTRPETMFGDVCVVVNPHDLRYKHLIGKKVINPANGDYLPIIADEYVDMEFGTGAMKCTPAHDANDFLIGEKYGFPRPIIMEKDATMSPSTGIYQGLDRYECRKQLVEKINKDGNLIRIEKIVHTIGYSERSNAVIEPYLSKQWFVKMTPLAKQSLDNQKTENKVSFYPERFAIIFESWMEKAEDWCISRQLWWGHRIPAYYHNITGEVYVGELPPQDKDNYHQDEDVLDTWFSSALWPFSTLGWPQQNGFLSRYYPIDVLVTAYDIIFFWVSRMIFQGLEFTGKRPFNDCLIHGLIRDSQGRKMTKSLGNGIDPIKVIENYGADSLRYFITTNSTPGLDSRYSEEKLGAANSYLNKIWNASRYILMTLGDDFLPESINFMQLNVFDRYILTKFNETIRSVTYNMDKYELANASTHLYNFVYDDFCSWYLEISKVTMFGDDETAKKLTKQVLFHILKGIIMMIYPYTPFISEEIYLAMNGHGESIMNESYPQYNANHLDDESVARAGLLFSIIKDIRNYKVTNSLAPNAPIILHFYDVHCLIKDFIPYLEKFTFAKVILFHDDSQSFKDFNLFIYHRLEMAIEEQIDKEEVKKKLDLEIAALQSEVARSTNMLQNENFMAKAPSAKIALENEKLQKYKEQLTAVIDKRNKL